MVDETVDALREMALHRGLKLVRSRRRKAGTGDFGKFGLIDAAGKALLGIGDDGLTASATEIEDYLRAGATSTWAQSAKLTPDRKTEPSPQPAKVRVAGKSQRGAAAPTPEKTATRPPASPARAAQNNKAQDPAPASKSLSPSEPVPKPKAAPPPPEPKLTLRSAKPSDAAALAKLLGQLADTDLSEHEAARHLAALRKSGGGVDIAELGQVIGCIAWSVVPTLQRGAVGRISLLVVNDRHRRRGIGKALLGRAEVDLATKGCTLVEVMSDTDLKNSHGFFRTLDFEQKSYRFIRALKRP
jgi:N-acetylglutamate synthase-like GNAT family acetyltransferase